MPREWKYPVNAIKEGSQVEILRKEMEKTLSFWESRRSIRSTSPSDSQELSKLTAELCNMAFDMHRRAMHPPLAPSTNIEPPIPIVEEPLDEVERARKHWEASVADEVHELAKDTQQVKLWRRLQVFLRFQSGRINMIAT